MISGDDGRIPLSAEHPRESSAPHQRRGAEEKAGPRARSSQEAMLRNLAGRRKQSLLALVAARAKHDVEFQDVLVFVALGVLNFGHTNAPLRVVTPASIASLSGFLNIPKETMRRRLTRLIERKLAEKAGQGFVVRDLRAWQQLSDI